MPTDTIVTLTPLTVQTPVVRLVTVTASPDEDVGATLNDVVLKVFAPGLVNVIVWLALAITNERSTTAAAFQRVSPD